MADAITIHFTPTAGAAVDFTVLRVIPEAGDDYGTNVKSATANATPQELWESVAGDPATLTSFLEQEAASGNHALWSLDRTWQKLRVTLKMGPDDDRADWP